MRKQIAFATNAILGSALSSATLAIAVHTASAQPCVSAQP